PPPASETHTTSDGSVPTSIAAASRRFEPGHLYKAIGLFFLLLILYAHFDPITRVLLIVFASAILAIALNVLVELVPQYRRAVSALLGLLILAAIGAAFWFAVPALAGQLRGLSAEVPRFQEVLQRWSEWLQDRTGLNVQLVGEQTQGFLGDAFGSAQILGQAMSLVEGIFLPFVIIIGAVYAVARPNERLLNPLLRAVPADRRDSFHRLFSLLGIRLKGWVKGTLISILVVGLLSGIGLTLLGVRFAFLLGVISGLSEIVPIIGPWVAGAVAVAVAVLDDPTKAMWVAGLMLVIQQLESNLITPLVMAKAAEVHPFITIFALFLFGSIFGFLGILLALPLVILVWTIVEVLWVERAIHAAGDSIEPVVEE
ncbi:MAG: AI-2E family transporter, partial [Gemmatimonadota bacterium]